MVDGGEGGVIFNFIHMNEMEEAARSPLTDYLKEKWFDVLFVSGCDFDVRPFLLSEDQSRRY